MNRDRSQFGLGPLSHPSAQLPQRLRTRDPVESDCGCRPVQGSEFISLEVHLRQRVVLFPDSVSPGLPFLTGHRPGNDGDPGVGQLVHISMKGPFGGRPVRRVASRVGPAGDSHPLVDLFDGKETRRVDQCGDESKQSLQPDLLRFPSGTGSHQPDEDITGIRSAFPPARRRLGTGLCRGQSAGPGRSTSGVPSPRCNPVCALSPSV